MGGLIKYIRHGIKIHSSYKKWSGVKSGGVVLVLPLTRIVKVVE